MKLKEMAAVVALAIGGGAACNSTTPGPVGTNHVDKMAKAPKTDVTSVPATSVATSTLASSSDDPKPTNGSLGPEYKTIESFADFRKKLLADGWKPVINPKCHEAVLGYDYGNFCRANKESTSCRVCDKVPEIVNDIGGVGYVDGYNLMHYTKNGMPLSVTVYGDLRGLDGLRMYELIVVGWEFTMSHDAIPLDEHVPREGK